MLAVFLAMISLPDLDPEPIKTPAATVGQRLSGGSGTAVEGMLDGPALVGDVQFTATCGLGVMPIVGTVLGDMSALSRGLTSPACVPSQGSVGGWLASPFGYGSLAGLGPFGEFGPVALPVFGVRPPAATTLHLAPPAPGAFTVVGPPSTGSVTARRNLETGGETATHRTFESSAPVSPATRALSRPAPARSGR